MDTNNFKQLQLNFSGMGCWLTLAIGFILTMTVGLGWLLKSLMAIVALLILLPVLLVVGVQIWLRRNFVQGDCPSCGQAITGFKSIPESTCMHCGVGLQIKDGRFVRATPEGTIDVDVVNATSVDDDGVTVVNVDVLPPAD